MPATRLVRNGVRTKLQAYASMSRRRGNSSPRYRTRKPSPCASLIRSPKTELALHVSLKASASDTRRERSYTSSTCWECALSVSAKGAQKSPSETRAYSNESCKKHTLTPRCYKHLAVAPKRIANPCRTQPIPPGAPVVRFSHTQLFSGIKAEREGAFVVLPDAEGIQQTDMTEFAKTMRTLPRPPLCVQVGTDRTYLPTTLPMPFASTRRT